MEKNEETAFQYYQKAADGGHNHAQCLIGGRMPTIAENSDDEMAEEEDEEEDEFYYPEELRAMYPHVFS